MHRTTVGVVFGGVSPEHEVSVISSHQVMAAMDRSRFDPVPIYVAKDGRWYTGSVLEDLDAYRDLDSLRRAATAVTLGPDRRGRLRLVPNAARGLFRKRPDPVTVDVLFLGFHGGAGENGGMQGLCEAFDVPYTGSGVMGSAIGMDKVLSKKLCIAQGISVVDYVELVEWEWADNEDDWLDRVERELGFPVVVKPARLGSSIGIAFSDDRNSLDAAIEEAFRYDDKIVVEKALRKLREINCSVLGDARSVRLSMLEQPVRSGADVLTFADKYQRGGDSEKVGRSKVGGAGAEGMARLDRIIPAPVGSDREAEIKGMAESVFRLFECSGVVRIDFMIDEETDKLYFNEVNTIPGSFSFYLWEPAGLPFTDLVSEMIDIALRRHSEASSRVRTYDVNLLSERSLSGLKGAKARR